MMDNLAGLLFILAVLFTGYKLLKHLARTTNHVTEPTSDKAALNVNQVNAMPLKTYEQYFGIKTT